MLHKFAITTTLFLNRYFRHASSYNVHVYQFPAKLGAYINFQQNRVCRSVITVYTNVFKNQLFQTCVIIKRICMSIFSKIGLIDQSKPCTQIYLPKNANCINLQLAIRILKNHAFRIYTTPKPTFRSILVSIGLLDIKLPQKDIDTDGRTDSTTDGHRQ